MGNLSLSVVTHNSTGISFGCSIFMAGGISGCSDWQSLYIDQMKTKLDLYADYVTGDMDEGSIINATLFNPRRSNFDVNNKSMEEEQISWEFKMLHSADLITFWFPSETVCPIVCYEIGYWLGCGEKEIIIGVDPNYVRKSDIEIQSRLAGYDKPIYSSVESLVTGTVDFLSETGKLVKYITPF